MDEKKKQNQAALYLLKYHNNQKDYFGNLLNKHKEDDWIKEEYKMELCLNKACIDIIENWLTEQEFDYDTEFKDKYPELDKLGLKAPTRIGNIKPDAS